MSNCYFNFFIMGNVCTFDIINTSLFKSMKKLNSSNIDNIIKYIFLFINFWFNNLLFFENDAIFCFLYTCFTINMDQSASKLYSFSHTSQYHTPLRGNCGALSHHSFTKEEFLERKNNLFKKL